jgi:hypothetical protein
MDDWDEWKTAEDIECERRLRELMGKGWDCPDLPWEAILTTSSARTHVDCMGSSDADGYMASDLLKALVGEGIEVYIVTTRPTLYPDGCDKCMYDLVPEENFFISDPLMLRHGGANDPAYIDAWTRCLTRMGIEIPPYVPWTPPPRAARMRRGVQPSELIEYALPGRAWMDLAEVAGKQTDILVRR